MEKRYQIIEYGTDQNGRPLMGRSTATIFYGQCGEDLYVYSEFFHNHLDLFRGTGTYIEIGASDGVQYSNSKFFEDELGFTGVLIEPLSEFYKTLEWTRPNNRLYNCAVSSSGEPVEFLVDPDVAGYVSGMSHTMSDQHKQQWFDASRSNRLVTIDSKRMSTIMNESSLEYVDLFSIDVEGGEFEVLNTIDWSIPVYVFIVELGDTEKDDRCRELLADKGYVFSSKIGLSEIWYDPSYIESRM